MINDGRKSSSHKSVQVIHLAIVKYSVENFKFEIIEEVDIQRQANDRETHWVAYYDSLKNGYNCTHGGMNAPKTEEWIAKVVAARMANGGYGHSEETKKAMSDEWHEYHSPDSMKKCHDANKGRECSEEHRQKLSEANKGNQYCLDHKQSEETIKKRMISIEAKYGSKVCGAFGCDRIDGYKYKGVRYCNKHVQRLEDYGNLEARPHPKPTLGKKMSEETKRKISESKKGSVAHNKKVFSSEQVDSILRDTRPLRQIGSDFNVSRQVISRIKRQGTKVA